jgi:hypothetical protein
MKGPLLQCGLVTVHVGKCKEPLLYFQLSIRSLVTCLDLMLSLVVVAANLKTLGLFAFQL